MSECGLNNYKLLIFAFLFVRWDVKTGMFNQDKIVGVINGLMPQTYLINFTAVLKSIHLFTLENNKIQNEVVSREVH